MSEVTQPRVTKILNEASQSAAECQRRVDDVVELFTAPGGLEELAKKLAGLADELERLAPSADANELAAETNRVRLQICKQLGASVERLHDRCHLAMVHLEHAATNGAAVQRRLLERALNDLSGGCKDAAS